jgi:hypothetical protein
MRWSCLSLEFLLLLPGWKGEGGLPYLLLTASSLYIYIYIFYIIVHHTGNKMFTLVSLDFF